MKTIAFVIPYFGELSNYFYLWMKSAEYNPTIDFYLFTNNDIKSCKKNIHIINTSFLEIQKRIHKFYGTDAIISNPYKLCDYRPMYIDIFEDVLKNYDFWGYCDVDVILGDIRKFLNDNILENYDKIYELGHMTLMKNEKSINKLYQVTAHKAHSVFDYKEVIKSKNGFHFDEGCGISIIARKEKIKIYDQIDFADLSVDTIRFVLAQKIKYYNNNQIFNWRKGKLYRVIEDKNKIVEQEIIYVHLQKRKMNKEIDLACNDYYIIPNKFIEIHDKITPKLLRQYSTYDKLHIKKLQIKLKEIIDRCSIEHLKVVIRNLKYR